MGLGREGLFLLSPFLLFWPTSLCRVGAGWQEEEERGGSTSLEGCTDLEVGATIQLTESSAFTLQMRKLRQSRQGTQPKVTRRAVQSRAWNGICLGPKGMCHAVASSVLSPLCEASFRAAC